MTSTLCLPRAPAKRTDDRTERQHQDDREGKTGLALEICFQDDPTFQIRSQAVHYPCRCTAAEDSRRRARASLQELRQLVETLGWDIVGTLTQKLQSPTAASLIGPGKLHELSELVKAPSMAESVVFDHELTPTQVRHIREATGVEVYDRPAIILGIFHRHARTKEAQLQVELARLKYLAPRERVSGAKERRRGGRGARGVSESFHEIERRKVLDRTIEPQRELKAVHREQVHL